MVTFSGTAGDCTTPAENTGNIPLRALVDWVTCSFQSASNLQEVFNLIGIGNLENIEEFESSKFAKAGYTSTHRIGMIEYHRNEDENRWLLNMSGQGCRQFEVLSSFDLLTMFAILANLKASYTRLDIAIDDFGGIFKTNTIRQAVYNKLCVTRLADWGNGERGKVAHGKDFLTMDNFYLGSPKSRYFINFYDKYLERLNKMETAGEELQNRIKEELQGITQWTRTEIRLKDEYAEQFVGHILSDHFHLGFYIMSFLNHKLTFLKPSCIKNGKENRSRLAEDINNHARWWRKFVHNAGKLKLSVYKPDKMLVESKDWLYKQVSTTLASLALYKPLEFYDLIDDLLKDGMDKIKKEHLLKIYNQQHFDALGAKAVNEYEEEIERMPTIIKNRPSLDKVLQVNREKFEEQVRFDAINERKSDAGTSDF